MRPAEDKILLRRALPADAPEIVALHRLAFLGAWDRPWGEKSAGDLLRLSAGRSWLAMTGGDPQIAIGFLIGRIAADEAEILSLAIRPDWQRRGIAARLLAAAAADLGAAGAQSLFLEVAEANRAAFAFYRKAGFAIIGRRPRYGADGSAALSMRLLLS